MRSATGISSSMSSIFDATRNRRRIIGDAARRHLHRTSSTADEVHKRSRMTGRSISLKPLHCKALRDLRAVRISSKTARPNHNDLHISCPSLRGHCGNGDNKCMSKNRTKSPSKKFQKNLPERRFSRSISRFEGWSARLRDYPPLTRRHRQHYAGCVQHSHPMHDTSSLTLVVS